jgi:hypothetical protein
LRKPLELGEVAEQLRNVYDLRPEIEENGSRKRSNFPEIAAEDFWELYDESHSATHASLPRLAQRGGEGRVGAALPGTLAEKAMLVQ